ncbi:MAG: tetratricopeptide repeat protein [Prochloraceae cyanobacterium]|nr:tetratricopeptide repeat protein [Prochloraceae cyanobacterium]
MSKFTTGLASILTGLLSIFPSFTVSAQEVNSYQDFYLFCSHEAFYYKVESPDCSPFLNSRVVELAALTRLIELEPNNFEAYNNRGRARQRLEDLWGSITDYTRAIELNPADAAAFNNRGLAFLEVGYLAQAIADYTRAIEIDPNVANFHNNRGIARIIVDDFDRGCFDFVEGSNLALQNNDTDNYTLAFRFMGLYCNEVAERLPQRYEPVKR